MSIPIIGQSRIDQPAVAERLPRAELSLGSPNDAPAGQVVRDRDGWAALATHPAPMIRGLLLEHIAREHAPVRWADVLMRIAEDGQGAAAERALTLLGEVSYAPAADLAEARFRDTEGDLAAAAATVLGRVDAARLLEATRARARLDDLAYVQTMSALARSEHEPALAWLGKSLNRAGALTAERRAALYSAVLLSGRPELCARVIGVALADSRGATEPDQVPPARVALASIGGLPPAAAHPESAEAILSSLLESTQRAQNAPHGVDNDALARAVEARELGTALDLLAPLLELKSADDESADRASVLRRRRGLLSALLAQRDAIAQLDASASAIFVAAAFSAAELISISGRPVTESPALAPLSKILEAEPAALLALDEDALVERFRADGERKMRQVAGALANGQLWSHPMLERWMRALVRAGGAAAVFEAAASTQQEAFAGAALGALTTDVEAGEAAALEALERRPLEDRPTRLGLAIAGRLGTERLSRAIARRYYDLREVARAALADACAHTGDGRLAPLLASRAYLDEPEELAWAMSALAAGEPLAGAIAEIVKRYDARGGPVSLGENEDGIRLPLRCKVCHETGAYTMVRVFLDPKSKDAAGDPAFAGDVRCKACGAEDQLEPTPSATSLMMDSMMHLLAEQRAGVPQTSQPRVIPRSTKFMGREVGLADALRRANEDVATSPSSIRAHLRRGRLGLALWRSDARRSAEAALEIDPRSPEALLLLGGTHAQGGGFEAAVPHMVAALELVRSDDIPRLYESDVDALTEEVEDALLELEDLGATLPDDLDLEGARARQAAAMAALEREFAAREGREAASPERPAILGRN